MRSGSQQNYYRNELNDADDENDAVPYRVNNSKTTTSKSLEYKTNITRKTFTFFKQIRHRSCCSIEI